MSLPFPHANRYGYRLPFVVDSEHGLAVEPGIGHCGIPSIPAESAPILGVAEIPMHFAAALQPTTSCRGLRQLAHETTRVIVDSYSSTADPDEVGSRLGQLESARACLHAEIGPLYRTAINENLQWVLGDDDYCRWYAQTYSSNNDRVTPADVQNAIDTLREDWNESHDEFETLIQDVKTVHGTEVAQSFIEYSLSPPLLSLEETTTYFEDSTYQLSTDIVVQRARKTCSRLLDLDPDEYTSNDIRQQIFTDNAVSATGDVALESGISFRGTGYSTQSGVEDGQFAREQLVGRPSGLSWFVHRAFDYGGFRAILFTIGGDPRWQTNPTEGTLPGADDTSPFEWTTSFVSNHLVGELLTPTKSTTGQEPIRCPLCSISEDRCGDTSCSYASEFEWYRQNTDAIRRCARRRIGQ